MKKILIVCALALVVVLAGCGGGGSGSSPDLGTNSDGSVTKTLSSSTDATVVSLDGNDGDRLSLSIPALSPGSADMEVNFKLVYSDGSTLPSLVIDKDIEFMKDVSFSFKSSVLEGGEYALIYVSDSGEEFTIPYTQDGDTLTALLTHFSNFRIVPEKDQPALESHVGSHLTSWENNNAAKKLEEVGMNSINGLYGEIMQVSDAGKRTDFLKRFAEAINDLADNSLSDWKTLNITYFTKHSMTEEFKSTIMKFARLYDLFDNLGTALDNTFGMLRSEITDIVSKEIDSSYSAWLEISPDCNSIDTPAYSKGMSDYVDFVTLTTLLYFDERVSFDWEGVMSSAGEKIDWMAQQAMLNGNCDCLEVTHSVLVEKFKDTKSSLINDVSSYMSSHCKNACPYLWNITYTHDYMDDIGEEELSHNIANFSFNNVILYPRSQYRLTAQEEEACSTYIANTTGISDTAYFIGQSNIEREGESDLSGERAQFKYTFLGNDGLARDPDPEIHFDKLTQEYKDGKGDCSAASRISGSQFIEKFCTDIFEEVYLHKTFSITDTYYSSNGILTFTPVGIR